MAMSYKELSRHPRQLLAMTGYTQQEFDALFPYFVKEFETTMCATTLQNTTRRTRAYGVYRNSPLPTMEDKLLFILVYLKQAPTQDVQGALFGMYQPEAHRWIHLLHGVVNHALAAAQELPARTQAAWQATEPTAGTYFHDGTERPIPRPRDAEKQSEMYSGKKKRHTVKNNILGDSQQKVALLTTTCEGKRHDKRVADEAAYLVPKESILYQDTGFQGVAMEGVTIKQPKKNPTGKALTPEEKTENQAISRIRIRIEHMIGSVKRYRIVKETVRSWKNEFRDQVMETCCGLHNFRLRFRPWTYPPLKT